MSLSLRAKRVWLLLVTTIVVALLAGSALFAIAGRGPSWLTGRAAPGSVAGAPAIRPDDAGAPGVNLDDGEVASAGLDARLSALDEAGIRWIRLRLPWDQIEPQQGQFRWSLWDRVFAAVAAHHDLQVLAVLDGSPAWARPAVDAANPLAPPQTRAHFGAFAAAVAGRYGGQLRYYQLWDEPNIAPHWGARPADPAGYAGLLREAAVQVRAADPDAQVVLAALAPTTEAGGANQSDVSYLDALYNLGARRWFDVVAGEPYGFSRPPEDRPDLGSLNFGRSALLRQVMVRHQDSAAPLWATSFGWNALPTGWEGRQSAWGHVTEAEQGDYASRALRLARNDWPWLGPMFWAADCPPAAGSGAGAPAADDAWRGFALCAAAGTPRPAWNALAAAAQAPALLPPGDHAMNHPALHYDPGWRVTAQAADPSANGDRLTFSFHGTGLALRVQGGSFWAYDTISVDGRPANALPRDESGAAYLALADPLAEVRIVPVAHNLPLGDHQVVIQATGGWDQWALQGILVTTGGAALPAAALPSLAVVALLIWLALAWPWHTWAGARLRAAQSWAAAWPPLLAWGLAAVVGGLFLLSNSPAFDLISYLLLGGLFLLRPELMLPLIAASIPLWPHPKPLLRWQFNSYELLIWLGTVAMVVRWLAGRWAVAAGGGRPVQGVRSQGRQGARPGWGRRLGLRGFDWPVLGLLGVGLAATLAAQRPGVAIREFRTVFLDGVLFYFLVTRILGNESWPETAWLPDERQAGTRALPGRPTASTALGCGAATWPILDGLVIGMLFVSGLALWQLATGQGRVDVEGVWRVRAYYGSPNNLALVLDRAVPIALAVALFAHTASLRRWLYGLAVPLMALACIATFSKGALLLGLPAGAGLVVLAGALRLRRRWVWGVLLAAVLTAALVLVVLFRTPRFADLLNFQEGTSFIRIKLWLGAWHMALDHPWLGVGPDNFLYLYRTRYVLPSAWEELNLSHPHNILLDLWTRLGVFGIAVGLWLIAAALGRAWRLFRRGSPQAWPVGLGLFGALVAMVGHGLIDNSLFLIDLMALFMLICGLLQVMAEE